MPPLLTITYQMELTQYQQQLEQISRISPLSPQQIVYIFEQLRDTNKYIEVILMEVSFPDLQSFIQILLKILCFPALSVEFGQHIAVIIGAIIRQKQHEEFNLCVNMAFGFFINFDIEPKFKRTILRILAEFMRENQKNLDLMFQRTIDVVIKKIIIALEKKDNQNSCEIQRLSFNNIQLQHDIVYEFPRQIPSIAQTALMLGQIFMQLEGKKNAYKTLIVQTFLRLSKIILRQEFIEFNPSLVLRCLEFWLDLIERTVLDAMNKDLSLRILKLIISQSQFHQQIKSIFNFHSPNESCLDKGIILHNYLLVPPEHKEIGLLTVKGKAAQLYVQLFQGSGYQAWKEEHICLQDVYWSAIYTFRQLVQLPSQFYFDVMEVGKYFMTLLFELIDSKVCIMNQEEALEMMGDIILPMIDRYMEKLRWQFNQEHKELKYDLEDTQDPKIRDTVVRSLTRMLQAILDGYVFTGKHLLQWCKQGLESNFTLGCSQSAQKFIMKTETCIFVLLVLSHQQQTFLNNWPDLQPFFIGQTVRKCDQFQKSLYFFFLAYNFNNFFKPSPEANDLARTAMQFPMGIQLQHFSLDFLCNISGGMLNTETYELFFTQFHNFGKDPLRWNVLQRILSQKISELTPSFVLKIVQDLRLELQEQFQRTQFAKAQDQYYLHADRYLFCETVSLLRLCKGISSEKDYCRQHPELKNALWDFYLTEGRFDNFDVGDLVIDIGTNLMLCEDGLPARFMQIQNKFYQYFSSCEYQGENSYTFIYALVEKTTHQQIQAIGVLEELIVEVFGYFVEFPDGLAGLEEHMLANLSNSILILQIFLLKFTSQLTPKYKQNIIQLSKNLWAYLKEFEDGTEMPLRGRVLNLRLILQLQSTQPFKDISLTQILNLVQSRALVGYDSCLLINLSSKLFDYMKGQERVKLLLVASVLWKWEKRREQQKKDVKKYSKIKHYYNIFDHINFSCQPFETLHQHIGALLQIFKKKDPNYPHYLQIISKRSQKEFDDLFNYFQNPTLKETPANIKPRIMRGWEDEEYVRKVIKRSRPKIKYQGKIQEDEEEPRRKKKIAESTALIQDLQKLEIERKTQK